MKIVSNLFKRADKIFYHVVVNDEIFDFDTFHDAMCFLSDYGSKNYVSSLSVTKVKLYNIKS